MGGKETKQIKVYGIDTTSPLQSDTILMIIGAFVLAT